MSRALEITVPPSRTDELVRAIGAIHGVVELRVQRGISHEPAGDVIGVAVTNPAYHAVLHLLATKEVLTGRETSLRTSEPLSLIRQPMNRSLIEGRNDSSWEEMESLAAKESNTTPNGLLLMVVSGFIAAIGIATDAIHVVIGAMAIAPGFLPIARIALGISARSGSWWRGLRHLARGYCAMIAGAAAGALLLRIIGIGPVGNQQSAEYAHQSNVLLQYWMNITPEGLAVSFAASLAGATLLATNRSVLTAGVMIALALVPAASLIGMSIVAAEWAAAGQAAVRWLIEVALVVAGSMLMLAMKRPTNYRRHSTIR